VRPPGLILMVILVGGGLFTFAVPVVPVSYQEAHQVQIPYEEQVAYNRTEDIAVSKYFIRLSYTALSCSCSIEKDMHAIAMPIIRRITPILTPFIFLSPLLIISL